MTRYVLGELLTPTLLGLLLYTFVLLMNHFFIVAEKSLAKNLGFDLTLRMFLVGLPAILILSIPMSVLLGCLISVGRISSDHEWVALQSAGQGPSRLLRPILLFGLLASLAAFYVYAELVPRTNYTARQLQARIVLSSSLASDLKPRVFYTQLHDVVVYVEDILTAAQTDQGRLRGVLMIRSLPKGKTYEVIRATSGDLYPAADQSGTLVADLYDGVMHRYQPDAPQTYHLAAFNTKREPIPPPPYLKDLLAPPKKVVSDMTTRELIAELSEAKRAQQETIHRLIAEGREPDNRQDRFIVDNRVNVTTVELSSRFAFPATSLFFAALALPLGITRARSGKGAGFALSLVVIIIYWFTYTFARDQALLGKIPAWLGPWIANLLLVPWAAWATWRMRRPRDTGLLAALLGSIARAGRRLRRLAQPPRVRPGELVLARSNGENEEDAVPALENLGGTSTRFVVRLDQYIAVQYLKVFVFALSSTLILSALVEVRGLADDVMRTGQSWMLLLAYLKYFAPSVLHIVLPISCLIGAVVAYTLLARTGELTAIKASGVSMRRATLPVLFITAGLCALFFVVQNKVAPAYNRLAQETQDRIVGRAPKTYGTSSGGRWGLGPDGTRLYHYMLYDEDHQEFQGLTVFALDTGSPRLLDHSYAQKARWHGTTAELENGWTRGFAPQGAGAEYEYAYDTFEGTRTFEMEPPAQKVVKDISLSKGGLAEQMSLAELSDEIEFLDRRGYDTTRLEVAFHGKISRSVAPFVMVLLGLPFAFRVGRRGSLYGIGVALLLVLVYWAVYALFNALGLETLLEPWAAAWAPNILFGLLGSYLLLYIPT